VCGTTEQVWKAGPVRHQPPNFHMLFQEEHGRDVVLQRQLGQTLTLGEY
jgi:hypothetical protein